MVVEGMAAPLLEPGGRPGRQGESPHGESGGGPRLGAGGQGGGLAGAGLPHHRLDPGAGGGEPPDQVALLVGQVRVPIKHGIDLRVVDDGHACRTTSLGPAEQLLLDGQQLGGGAAELATRAHAGQRHHLG